MSIPRPRIGLLVALVATLALLCCGGSVSAVLLGGLDAEKEPEFSMAGCGGDLVDPDGELPSISAYGKDQMRNAAIIINVGKEMGLPPRAWVIAIATAMQESRLTNLGHLGARNDHDSQGLFQQRPSAGWGTPAQVRDPEYASRKFYEKLKTVKGWETTALTRAAQRVQRSAYPNAYAKHEPVASQIVNMLTNGAARTAVENPEMGVCAAGRQIAASGFTNPVDAMVGSGFRTAARPTHQGVDLIVGKGAPIASVASGVVSLVKCDEDRAGRQTCNVDGFPGKGGCGWMVEIVHAGNVMTRYCHLVERPAVQVGQQLSAGDVIGRVGSSGNSSGPHLHFEVHLNNDRTSRGAVNPAEFMRRQGSLLRGES